MLGGRISNQDEDDVEIELDALEVELNGVPLPHLPTKGTLTKDGEALPSVPTAELLVEEGTRETTMALQNESEDKEEGRMAVLA